MDIVVFMAWIVFSFLYKGMQHGMLSIFSFISLIGAVSCMKAAMTKCSLLKKSGFIALGGISILMFIQFIVMYLLFF